MKEAEEKYNKITYCIFFVFKNVDGTQFSPDVSKDEALYFFSPDICRYALLFKKQLQHNLSITSNI